MTRPLAQQYGPSVNVQNNVLMAGADFPALVQRMEQQLAGRPPSERNYFVKLLRSVAADDAAPLIDAFDDAAE
jgi:hypothetical protein